MKSCVRRRLALICIGLVSCTPATDVSSPVSGVSQGPAFGLDSDGDVVFAPAGLVAAARAAGASAEQVALLEDGEVTFAEYEGAILAMVECARQEAIEVVVLGVDETGGFPRVNYAIPAEAPGLTEAEILSSVDGCGRFHSERVEAVWQLGHGDGAARLAKMVACLRSNDMDVSTSDVQEVLKAVDELIAAGGPNCADLTG